MNNVQIMLIADAKQQAEDGVDYDAKDGALCPYCKEKVRIHVTKPWFGELRLRYHRCENPACALCILGQSIKSWQKQNGHGEK